MTIQLYKVLSIFAALLVFHTFVAATLARIGLTYSVYTASMLPYIFAFIMIFLNNSKPNKFLKTSVYQWIAIVTIGFLYSVYAFFTHDDLSYIGSFKTFFIMPIQLLILYYLLPNNKSIINFKKIFFLLLYIISIYSIIEWLVRTYSIPYLFDLLRSYVEIIEPAGLNYLPFGGGFGVLPLGIFWDLHTASVVISLTALLAFVEKKYILFFLSLIALILSARATSVFAFLVAFYTLIIPLRFSIITIPLAPIILHLKYSGTHSYDVISGHFMSNFEPILNNYIIFGNGYTTTDKVGEVGYNEVFFILFFHAFGFVGIFLLLYLMYFLYISMKPLIINNTLYRYDRLAVAYMIVFLLGLLHYNLSFVPFVLFMYTFVAYYIRFYNNNQIENIRCYVKGKI